jgi:hypothetical protein
MARRAPGAIVVAMLAAAAVAACGGAQRGSGDPAVIASPPPIAPPTPTDLRVVGAKAITIRGRWLSAGVGGVWLSAPRAIHRLDGATGRRVATVRVPHGPCEATDIGFGFLWTATCGAPGLERIDPATNRVTGRVALAVPRELGGEASVGAGAGAVWLVVDGTRCTACRVARVDPRSMRVTARIPIMSGAAAVRAGAGSVWVSNPDNDVVQQIDPRRGRVVRTVRAGDMPRFLVAGSGGVWALNQADGTVTAIDPRTTRTRTADAGMHGSGGDLAASARWLWARGGERFLTRVDPRSRQVVERYGPDAGDGSVIVGFGAVWVSAPGADTLWRLPLDRVAGESRAT